MKNTHEFKKNEMAVLVIPNPSYSRGFTNCISKEEAFVHYISKNEIKINNRNAPIATYEIVNLYGILCGKRTEDYIGAAYLFANERDYDKIVKCEEMLSQILSHVKGEHIKTLDVDKLGKVLSILNKK